MSSAYSASVWLFNVQGTLAPAGGRADERFLVWFLEFAKRNDVRLVSELDYPVIAQLLGPELLKVVRTCYAARGNSVWMRGERLHELSFSVPAGMLKFLEGQSLESLYPIAHGSEVSMEHGVLRFKVLGAETSPEDLECYAEWDDAYNERRSWAKEIMSAFPAFEAQPVGEHFIDIYPVGRDKTQVLGHITQPVVLVGQTMDTRANDFRLARALAERQDGSKAYHSTNWATTFALVQSLRNSDYGPIPVL